MDWISIQESLSSCLCVLIVVVKLGYRNDRARLFSEVHSDTMRGNEHKLEHGEIHLGIKQKFLP